MNKEEYDPNLESKYSTIEINRSVSLAVSNLINLIIFIFAKNNSQRTTEDYVINIEKAVESVNDALIKTGQKHLDVKLQKEMFRFIIGICREDFGLIADVPSKFKFNI